MGYPSDYEMNNPSAGRELDPLPQVLTINEVVRQAHITAISKGFYTHHEGHGIIPGDAEIVAAYEPNGYRHISGESAVGLFALIHSEVSEAMEAHRNNEGDDRLAEELADIVIRVADAAAYWNLDLSGAIEKKMAANKERPHRHGGKRY